MLLKTGLIRKLSNTEIESIRSELRNCNLKQYGNTQRSVSHIGPDYPFSNQVVKGQSWSNYPNIKALMETLNKELNTNFNSCLINYYSKGTMVGIGKHTDKEYVLVPNSPVASISLGINSDCKFILKHIGTNTIHSIYTLSHGDVFYMDNECQNKYTHEIPKTLFPNGRMSLTFRVFKQEYIQNE